MDKKLINGRSVELVTLVNDKGEEYSLDSGSQNQPVSSSKKVIFNTIRVDITSADNSVVLLPSNPNRVGFMIQNNIGANIWIGFNSDVNKITGIIIRPEGFWFPQLPYDGEVYVFTDSETSRTLAVTEVLEFTVT